MLNLNLSIYKEKKRGQPESRVIDKNKKIRTTANVEPKFASTFWFQNR
jgi:hypothetical protein